MLHPPAMVYNEGRQEPRLAVGPPVSLDLAIRQRVTQNVIFEAHFNGIRATDTTLYQAGTIGQLNGGGYSSLAANPYQYAQDPAGRMHWNPIAAGEVPGGNVRRLPVLAPYVWPQREHVQLLADVRPPDRCMPVPDAVYYSRDDLHDKRTREIEDGGGTETKITQENSPATVGDASAKGNHAVNAKTDAEITLSQEKSTGSAQVLVVTEKPTANIYLINQFPSEANTSGTSASTSRDPSAPPRNTTTTPPSAPSPHQSINPQEEQPHPSVSPRTTNATTTPSAPSSHWSVHPQEEPERPPPATTTATDDNVHILNGAEALQAQRNEELENNFQAFHGFPPRRLSLDKIVTVKREAGEEEEEKGELQGERGGSSGEDEMEVCSD